MPGSDELFRQIMRLQPDERQILFFRLAAEPSSYSGIGIAPWMSGIEISDDVCGGEPRIVRTRIPVWVLEQMRRLGLGEAEILRRYPTLRAEDLVHAWAYVDVHRREIDEQIQANEEA